VPRLRSKRELIEEFITAYLPTMKSAEQTTATFEEFWAEKREAAFQTICTEEKLDREGFAGLLEAYQFSGTAFRRSACRISWATFGRLGNCRANCL
jgi:type I restriction enzyme R subunit